MNIKTRVISFGLFVVFLIAAHLLLENRNWTRLNPSGTPSWASFFTLEEYQEFTGLVRKSSAGMGYDYSRIDEGFLSTEAETTGLLNLAQNCQLASRPEWPQIIEDWFLATKQKNVVEKEWDEKKKRFEQVKDVLTVRIWPESLLDTLPKGGPDEYLIYRKTCRAPLRSSLTTFPITSGMSHRRTRRCGPSPPGNCSPWP